MNEELAGLFEGVEVLIENISFGYEPDPHALANALQDIKDYLSSKEITDPKRKCVDETHHFKGCDCW